MVQCLVLCTLKKWSIFGIHCVRTLYLLSMYPVLTSATNRIDQNSSSLKRTVLRTDIIKSFETLKFVHAFHRWQWLESSHKKKFGLGFGQPNCRFRTTQHVSSPARASSSASPFAILYICSLTIPIKSIFVFINVKVGRIASKVVGNQ